MALFRAVLILAILLHNGSQHVFGDRFFSTRTKRYSYGNPNQPYSMFGMNSPMGGMSSYPATSMGSMTSYPGTSMGATTSDNGPCVLGSIVCPAYCIMEDEWGCKYCPCGPANGMSPPVVRPSYHEEHRHEEAHHDCLGTILCMLTCKDGYQLGPKRGTGCQACRCVKRNTTTNTPTDHVTTETTTTKPEHNNSSKPPTGGDGCVWPLCMNGHGPNTGPGIGSAMTSLPSGGAGHNHNGSSPSTGGSLPGVDCMGPACSAKNGMRTSGMHSPPTAQLTLAPPPNHASAPTPSHTDVQRTPGVDTNPFTPTHEPIPSRPLLISGSHSSPHVPMSGAAIVTHNKTSEQVVYPLILGQVAPQIINIPGQHIACPELEQCKRTCVGVVKLESNVDGGCDICTCLTIHKPEALQPIQTSPQYKCDTIERCRKSCDYGFEVMNSRIDECPKCSCIIPAVKPNVVAPPEPVDILTARPDSSLNMPGPNTVVQVQPNTILQLKPGTNIPLTKPDSAVGTGSISAATVLHVAYPNNSTEIKQAFVIPTKPDSPGAVTSNSVLQTKPDSTEELRPNYLPVVLAKPGSSIQSRPDGSIVLRPVSLQPARTESIVTETPDTSEKMRPDPSTELRGCPEAVHCMRTCPGGYSLTTSPQTRCPLCICHDAPKVLLLCERPLSCLRGCGVGYKCDSEGCPTCSCVEPHATSHPVAGGVNTYMEAALECGARFSCVDRCPFGYKTGANGCPTCVCLEPLTVSSDTCDRSFSCPVTCKLGYKAGGNGCPTCTCVLSAGTHGQTPVQNEVAHSAVTCNVYLPCVGKCQLGYRTGDGNCPTCECLQSTNAFTPVSHVTQIHVPAVPQPSGIGCLGPSCPSTNELGQSGNLFFSAVEHQGGHLPSTDHVTDGNAGVGNTVQTVPSVVNNVGQGLPLSPGNTDNLAPVAMQKPTISPSSLSPLIPSLSTPSVPSLGELIPIDGHFNPYLDQSTTSSINTKPVTRQPINSAPMKTATERPDGQSTPNVSQGHAAPTVAQTPVVSFMTTPGPLVPVTPLVSVTSIVQPTDIQVPNKSPNQTVPLPVVEECREAVRCMVTCDGTYELKPVPGQLCPLCQCSVKEHSCDKNTSCDHKNPNQDILTSTPSPGQCVAILHCVMTCTHGYDVGEYGKDGCPSCTCLD